MILPKKHLSKSQISLWLTNKNEYKRRYFLGEKTFVSSEMQFGTQNENTNQTQTEIKIDILGLSLFGILDHFDENKREIREDKTGKQEWDILRVKNSWDYKFYTILVYHKFGFIPDFFLRWEETKGKGKDIDFTGRVENFAITNEETSLEEIQVWEKEILDIAENIEKEYKDFLDNTNGNKELDLFLQEYAEKKEAFENIESEFKNFLETQKIEDYKSNFGTIYTTTKKKWEYSKDIVAMESDLKDKKKEAEKKGIATFTESKSLSIKV